MKTNLSAIKKAYKIVTCRKQYKYKKSLINAIYVELFLTGCNEVSESEINSFLSEIEKEQKGKERKNNPFGYREMSIIDNYNGELFEFKGFYDAGRYNFHNYLPVYELSGMEYYVCGEIQIIG